MDYTWTTTPLSSDCGDSVQSEAVRRPGRENKKSPDNKIHLESPRGSKIHLWGESPFPHRWELKREARTQMDLSPLTKPSGKMSSIEEEKEKQTKITSVFVGASSSNRRQQVAFKKTTTRHLIEEKMKRWPQSNSKNSRDSLFPPPGRETDSLSRCEDAGICSRSGWMLGEKRRLLIGCSRRWAPAYRHLRCPRCWSSRTTAWKMLLLRGAGKGDQYSRGGFYESLRLGLKILSENRFLLN